MINKEILSPTSHKLPKMTEVAQKNHFTFNFVPSYEKFDGMTLPSTFKKLKEKILDLDVREQDVWVSSIPRSGSTMTVEMVWMIINDLNFEEGAKRLIIDRAPVVEFSCFYDHEYFSKIRNDGVKLPPSLKEDTVDYLNSQTQQFSKLCIKTHLPWQLLPRHIQDGVKYPKIIYVARNPKDVCISYYHYSKMFGWYCGKFEDFCELFMAGEVPWGPYWDRLFSYWNRRDQPNILFIKYEDMVKRLPETIKQVSEFLNKSLTEEQVKSLAEHLSLRKMKENPSITDQTRIEWFKKHNYSTSADGIVRKGVAGGYKDDMTPKIIRVFDKWIAENTKGTDFTYDC